MFGNGHWMVFGPSWIRVSFPGNFFTTILLARYLPPSEYGVYALLFALMLIMNGFHSALIWYGLSLHGAAVSESGLRPLVGGALVLTTALAAVLGLGPSVAAVLLQRPLLVPWILLALLFWQLQETTRRALMCRLRFRGALGGDALSYLGQAACIAYFFAAHRLTLTSAFIAMTATSAAATLLQAAQLRLTLAD